MIYEAIPKKTIDQWLFYEDCKGGLDIRNEYTDLRCQECMKIDEFKALDLGVSINFQPKLGSLDIVGTPDDWCCISKRMYDLIIDNKIIGLNFHNIISLGNCYVVAPNIFIPTNEDIAGYRITKLCSKCNRPFERVGPATADGMKVCPDNELKIYTSSVPNESIKSRSFPLLMTKSVFDIFKKARFKGIEYECY